MSTDNMSDLELTLTDLRKKKNVVFILFSFISFVLKKIYIPNSKFRKKKGKERKRKLALTIKRKKKKFKFRISKLKKKKKKILGYIF